MLRKIEEYMKQNHILSKGDRIVLGVSGGADSVCLLHVLYRLAPEYGLHLIVVHINHGIRGEEADRDEAFVREICNQWKLEFRSFHFDIIEIAKKERLSEEEAGRNIRYQTFIKVCKDEKCNKIAIAHNKDDNAETILFHLFRGSGIKGLTGIDSNRLIEAKFGEITLIRPLLCVKRNEIEDYLDKNKLVYQIDKTNLTLDYSRNKIRNKVLSYVTQEINANAVEHIDHAASQLKEINAFLEKCIGDRYKALVRTEEASYLINVDNLIQEDIVIQKGIIYGILERLARSRKDLEAKHVQEVLNLLEKQVGRRIELPYQIVAERQYKDIIFYKQPNRSVEGAFLYEKMEPMVINIPGRQVIREYQKILDVEIIENKKNEPIPKSSCIKWFDYDKIENTVVVRNRSEGDYIQIDRLGGRKKIKDFFIDIKLPRKDRDKQILIADGNHIMWIPGKADRISEGYKVSNDTKKILLMKLIDMED